jgi:hypothetical protein
VVQRKPYRSQHFKDNGPKVETGRPTAATDHFYFEGKELQITGSYTYLGLTIQTSLSFGQHIARKKAAGLSAVGSLKHLQKLSIQTILQIYHMKIIPVVNYGLDVAAPLMTLQNLREIDKVKSALLKAALGLHRSASSTLAHELFGTPTLSWDLKNTNHQFDETVWQSYLDYREERNVNFVAENFTEGPAFTTTAWKNAYFTTRHILTRATAHGFHHLLCQAEFYHNPLPSCICKYCISPASNRNHILLCRYRTFFKHSLSAFVLILQ